MSYSTVNTVHLVSPENPAVPLCGAALVKYVSPIPTRGVEAVNCPVCLEVINAEPAGVPDHPNGTPHWKHDCAACHYLGSRLMAGRTYDLYHCPGNAWTFLPTLVARYGDGAAYLSGFDLVDTEPLLALAYVKAVKQGFLPPDTIK